MSSSSSSASIPSKNPKIEYVVIRGLLKTEGIPGFYRGFATVITGAIPVRIVLLSALETTKVAAFKMLKPFNISDLSKAAIANGIARLTSSLCAQFVFVPFDVFVFPALYVSTMGLVQGAGGILGFFFKGIEADDDDVAATSPFFITTLGIINGGVFYKKIGRGRIIGG